MSGKSEEEVREKLQDSIKKDSELTNLYEGVKNISEMHSDTDRGL